MRSLSEYISRVGIALSILLNVVTGGHSNQTFSARNYSWKRKGRWNICWLIDWFEEDHCMHRWINWLLIKKTLEKHGI